MQLFVQKGYDSTNVQDIADTAGISIGLLYRHYKSKETLFDELVDYALADDRRRGGTAEIRVKMGHSMVKNTISMTPSIK